MKDHQSGQKNGIPMLASACPGKGNKVLEMIQ